MAARSIFAFTWLMLISTLAFPQRSAYKTVASIQDGKGTFRIMERLHALKDSCGVYFTKDDYNAGKLSTGLNCKADDHKIKPTFVEGRSAIKIIRNRKVDRYFKRNIFGYRNCKGKDYHFSDGRNYEVLNPGENILFYRIYEHNSKAATVKYYFSRYESTDIKPLTLENLKEEFSNEKEFLKKLGLLAENDFQLVKYLYVINRLRLNSSRELNF